MSKFRKEHQKKDRLRARRCQAFYSCSKSGFTIVELTLSMAFVGVLLITIAIIITNVTAIYQKGLALKAVNSVGRSLTDEFTRAISKGQASSPNSFCDKMNSGVSNTCKGEDAFYFVFQEIVVDDNQLGGIFCTGDYSYIWNTKQGLSRGENAGIKLRYFDKDGSIEKEYNGIHLVRVEDPRSRVCSAMVDSEYKPQLPAKTNEYNGGILIDISKIPAAGYGESTGEGTPYEVSEPVSNFLTDFDLSLELYQLRIFPITIEKARFRRFMSGTFILGTKKGGIDITKNGDYCDVENTGSLQSLSSDFNYCAINKFNFAARTAGVSDENIGH